MKRQFVYLCFILIIKFTHSLRVCSRTKLVPYTQISLRRTGEPFHHHGNPHFGATSSRFRFVTETKYRTTYEYHCCDGYEGAVDNCRPICPNACSGNGLCLTPGYCLCHENYGGDDCQPICENCDRNEHSFCSKPGICECEIGYARNESSASNKCHPICEPQCEEHAHCVSPGKCECLEGYSMHETGKTCQPVCQQKCPEYAFCQQPDTCNCNLGYIMSGETCEPVCNNKCPENAKCIAPDLCECSPGYEKSNGTELCEAISPITSTTESISTESETMPTINWPKSTTQQRRSISSTTKIPLTPIPFTHCSSNCQCWTEFDELGYISNSKCLNICSQDDHKKGCLNLTKCHCYQMNGPIFCKESDEDESNEELQYDCRVRATITEINQKLQSQQELNQLSPKSYWPIIVGIITSVGAIVFAGLAFYYYNKRRQIEVREEPLLEENL